MSPAVWVAVAILCNASRSVDYAYDVEWAIGHLGDLKSFFHQPRASAYDEAALILSDPLWPDGPVLVFRHSRAMPMEEPCPRPDPRLLEDAQAQGISDTARKIIKVAKSMRRNPSSEPRRIKLLTPPRADSSADLPFLKSSRSA